MGSRTLILFSQIAYFMRGWKTRGEGIIRGLGRVSTPPFHYRPLFLLLGLLRWIHYIGPMVQRGHRDAWLGQYPDSCITRETMDSVWRGDTILVYMLQVYIYIYAAGFSPGVSM